MKVQELRLGSLIYWNIPEKKDTIHTVVGMRNDTPQTMPISLGESIDDYKPIPLTEEWLLRFGFTYQTMGIFTAPCKTYFSVVKWKDHDAEFTLIKDQKIPIKYVHELQALYYAITKQELTYEKSR